MSFAYPPRKTSNPPPFKPRASKLPHLRRSRVKTIAVFALIIIGGLWVASKIFSGHGPSKRQPSGNPKVLIVTTLDAPAYGQAHTDSIKENRIQYAARHGYETMFVDVDAYDLKGSPTTWSKVLALRHAMSKFPECRYMWYLDQDAYIMEPSISLEEHLMNAARLEELMLRDQSVVPPDSIIKTFTHLKGRDVDLVLTQDREGLSVGSFVVRNGEWAQYLLESWFDPLYRSYNFQKAENHALEHIVQWHPTILSKLAIVPQNVINAYNTAEKGKQVFKAGDFVVRAPGCLKIGEGRRTCEHELGGYKAQWKKAFDEA
ncbi:mannosyltransferase complex component [Plectosphaerella cucumerina]|uniref:Mannosyltransferase complex component n=1 Tax=Plectosphaerella cucumerina TaxID=40658 RepID=A0A8K0X5F9_9PEZI|nr:mannosyltransferase complex component [Plectosphaerella cucumerina]